MKKIWITCPMIGGQIYRCGEVVDETKPGVRGYVAKNRGSYKIQGRAKSKQVDRPVDVDAVKPVARPSKRKKESKDDKGKQEVIENVTRTEITEG